MYSRLLLRTLASKTNKNEKLGMVDIEWNQIWSRRRVVAFLIDDRLSLSLSLYPMFRPLGANWNQNKQHANVTTAL